MVTEGDKKDWESLENGRRKDRNGDKNRKLVTTRLGMRKGGEASFYTGGAEGTCDKVGFEAGGRRSSQNVSGVREKMRRTSEESARFKKTAG